MLSHWTLLLHFATVPTSSNMGAAVNEQGKYSVTRLDSFDAPGSPCGSSQSIRNYLLSPRGLQQLISSIIPLARGL